MKPNRLPFSSVKINHPQTKIKNKKTTGILILKRKGKQREWRDQEAVKWSEHKKMGGGMEANKNRFIEEWGAARENLEHNFRWTRRNLALVGLFGIAVPVFIYKGIVKEFVISLSRFSFLRSKLSNRYPLPVQHLCWLTGKIVSNCRLGLE